jgi:hypothetical protein
MVRNIRDRLRSRQRQNGYRDAVQNSASLLQRRGCLGQPRASPLVQWIIRSQRCAGIPDPWRDGLVIKGVARRLDETATADAMDDILKVDGGPYEATKFKEHLVRRFLLN